MKTILSLLISLIFVSAHSEGTPLGDFDGDADIGSPKLAGSASYDGAAQEYTIAAGGTDIWLTHDQFHFLWKKMNGDFILRARIEFVGMGASNHRKAGWMIRKTLDDNSPYVDGVAHGDGLTALQLRRNAGSNCDQIWISTNADVIQLERKGRNYIFSAARSGDPLVSATLPAMNIGDDIYAGLFYCSHNGDVLDKAVFRDVRIIRPPKAGYVPFHDYIGSVVQILDVQSGKLQQIYQSSQSLEAPTWTRDGAALIYSVSGRPEVRGHLCRFDLATLAPSIMNTGADNSINADHVLSFDGAWLAISDQTTKKSLISVLPVAGGDPKLIVQAGSSFCHGWSPDGKILVYTGLRNGKFDIYKIPSDGSSPEIRLTGGEGINDGPEFTPDGKNIYFNSTRTGKMQIWRVTSDGQNPEQITRDEFNNWFPHVSPDGKSVAFVSFGPEIEAKAHPYYKQIYIRLMPVGGGEPKVIAYVYGGQGTMNVSSWSPDSKKIAFISNTQ